MSEDPIGTVRREDVPTICEREDVIVDDGREVDSEEFGVAERRREEGDHMVGGGVFDEDGRILLIRNYWADGWTLPAGLAKHGETLDDAARREIREETGVDPELVDVIHVYHSEVVHEERDESIESYFVVFEGRARGQAPGDPAELGEDDDEIEAVDWFAQVPEDVYNRDLVEMAFDRRP